MTTACKWQESEDRDTLLLEIFLKEHHKHMSSHVGVLLHLSL